MQPRITSYNVCYTKLLRLEGRECSAYPACAPEVELAGGRYVDLAMDQAHRDGNLVTAPAWPAHPDWIAKFAALLGAKIAI